MFPRTVPRPARLLTALGAFLVAAPLVAAVPAQTASAAPPDPTTPTSPTGPADAPGSTASTITLITGDRVRLSTLPGGQVTAIVQPAPRPGGVVPQFSVSTHDGQTSVVPSDVAPLLPTHLDPALFNITALVDQDLDDDSSDTLPLIVSYPPAAARTLASRAVPAATSKPRELTSVSAVAVEVDKARIADLGVAVSRLAAATVDAGRPASRLAPATAGPLSGIERIWLDRQASVLLDRSTRQISAPVAWNAGVDGSGITVAVLDTGIDDTHPDLAGKVTAARNFTDEADAVDRFGHGTHVASIVAGTGAASGGAKRGVAPGAELINGKVLNSQGDGLLSWVIAGMEWAAGEADADIVNMSLGTDPGLFGADLVTTAVDNLTATTDTLFVVAAGNRGCDTCIDAPGDAPSALTVGAVDRADQLADFSSRGPAPETLALKPDITAPGVGISAARAKDALLGGSGPYLELDGTSMAAPHVAGAAALLAQARPEMTAAELKSALMSTAKPTAGLSAYEQGAGRVDVGHLMTSPALATRGSVDFGTLLTGHADQTPQEVTYRNLSDQPVTVELSAQMSGDRGPLPVSVAPAHLTIPPGGRASAEVTLDLSDAPVGRFTGGLTAQLPDASVLHTPLGVVVDVERFDLTLTALARDGRPALPWVGDIGGLGNSPVVNLDTGEVMNEFCPSAPLTICLRVPAGDYSVMAFVRTTAPYAEPGSRIDGFADPTLYTTLVGDPEVHIDGDTTLSFDAREAVEVTVDTPAHPRARANLGGAMELRWSRTTAEGVTVGDGLLNTFGSQLEERLFVQPMAEPHSGTLSVSTRWRLEEPSVALSVTGGGHRLPLDPRYYPASWFSDNSWQFPTVDGRRRLRPVDAGTGTAADLAGRDLRGALALIRRSDELAVAEQSNAAARAGAAMVAIYNDQPGPNADPGAPPGPQLRVPTVRLSHEDGVALLDRLDRGRGRVTVTTEGTMASPYVYDLVYVERHGVPDRLHYRATPDTLVRLTDNIHGQADATMTYTEAAFAFLPTDELSLTTSRPLYGGPRSRTVYHVSDPRIRWSYTMATPELRYNAFTGQPDVAHLRMVAPLTSYAPRERRTMSWLRQPLAVGLNDQFPVRRAQDLLILGRGLPFLVQAVGMVDGDGHFTAVNTDGGTAGFSTMFRLWQGQRLLYETRYAPSGPLGVVQLPSGDRQTYRMALEVANNAPWARLSTRTRTEWTFGSARTDQVEPVALLTAGYDVDVDIANRLRHGPGRLRLTVGHQDGVHIPVTEVSVALSYDDGKSWRTLPVRPDGHGHYTARLGRPPRGADFLSLRLVATDADGNRIDQQVIRAVALPKQHSFPHSPPR